jgi:hypothetical protein
MHIKSEERRLREQIALWERERRVLKTKLVTPKPMLEGSPVARYTCCGNAGCICHRDEKQRHGPYWYLSFQRNGKSKSRYIGEDKEKKKKVFAYQKHQANLAALRKVNRQIDEFLVEIQRFYLERPDEDAS